MRSERHALERRPHIVVGTPGRLKDHVERGSFDTSQLKAVVLDEATPALTEATRHLAPFTSASTVALKALGNAGEASGPIFAEAEPVVKKTRNLARTGASPTTKLAKFFVSTNQVF